MACSGRYAEALDFALLWCQGSPIVGTDTTANPPHAQITDATKDFTKARELMAGSPVYNATTGTYGKVLTVAATVLTTTNLFSNGDVYWALNMSAAAVATTEAFLDMAAGDVHAARMAADACDCTLRSGAAAYLKKLNVLDAAVWHNCPCDKPNISDSMRAAYLMEVRQMIDDVMTGKVELCQGETGSLFPAVAWAEHSVTEYNYALIVLNNVMRNMP